jgi:RNA polymerase sigma-70 factor (ECF subfamily)
LVRVAHAILRNREDAEDAVQNAFLSACRHASDFEGRSAFTTWLTRIVINAALMIRRKRRNGCFRPFDDLTTDEAIFIERIPDPRPDPEFACARAQSLAFIEGLLDELNPKRREAVSAAYHDELSAREASSLLALPFSRYKARLFRATHELQDRARRKRSAFITVS